MIYARMRRSDSSRLEGKGAISGMVALVRRVRRCRLGYAIELDGQVEPVLRLSDGSIARTSELSESMVSFVEQSSRALAGLARPGARIAIPGDTFRTVG